MLGKAPELYPQVQLKQENQNSKMAVSIASILEFHCERTLCQEVIAPDGILKMSWADDEDILELVRAAFICTKKLMFL